jgi:hypothetical protein
MVIHIQPLRMRDTPREIYAHLDRSACESAKKITEDMRQSQDLVEMASGKKTGLTDEK